MKLKILPYKMGSESAKALATELNAKRIASTPTRDSVVLNWGNSSPDFEVSQNFINLPVSVKTAANKLSTLLRFSQAGVPCPEYTTDIDVAQEWLDEGKKVVARHRLTGHSGDGIEVIRPGDYLPDAKVYTKYIKKEKECRVHIFQGHVIDYVEKKAKLDKDENYNPLIRNHENGWVFCREGVDRIEEVVEVARKAVAALRLDFGAVDVVFAKGKAYALEVNTAPGLCETTLNNYAIVIEEYMQHLKRENQNVESGG